MAEILVLRLVHVLGGVFWVGAGLFNFLFLAPAARDAGPAAMGPLMEGMRRRRMFTVLPAVAVLTILSGLRLMWITSGGFEPAYFSTGPGLTFTIAAVAAIVAWLLGALVVMPAQKRLGALGPTLATLPDEPARATAQAEVARLQRRMAMISPVLPWLLVIAAAGMAVGRYVRL